MVVSPRLPGILQTLRKHQHGDSKRSRMEECLPLDALEAIMGFLDRETLCTARLVSKTFCAAASAHVCSLTLTSTSEAVSFHRYPHLKHVTVRHAYLHFLTEEESFAQLDSRLRDVATALTVRIPANSASIAQTRNYLSQAALMPKLRVLTVRGKAEHESALLARCTNLEAIRFGQCSISVAKIIVTMTRLTFLDIRCERLDDDQIVPADNSWLGHATNLRSLQALCVSTFKGALQLIGNLTGLTGLTLRDNEEAKPTDSIAPLTRLTRLRSLCFEWYMTEEDLGMACSLGLGSLVDLELWGSEEASADCGRFLSRQTALTRLTLHGRQLCNLRHIGGVRIELLQCLEIHDIGVLDAEGLSVLCRATPLSALSVGTSTQQMGLSQVLARLTQLRALTLECPRTWDDDPNIPDLPLALSPLTALTKLEMHSHRLEDGDLGALLVLTGLRVLELRYCCLTADVLPELGVLTNLSSLTIEDDGVMSLARVSKALDPLRNARGLPPLHTRVW